MASLNPAPGPVAQGSSTMKAVMLSLLLLNIAQPTVTIENWKSNDVSPTPYMILRGRSGGDQISINGVSFPVRDGRFIGLAELKSGANHVQVGDATLSVTYRALPGPYVVQTHFAYGSDELPVFDDGKGGRAGDYEGRIDVGLKLIQALSAEMMNDAGYGRKTFALQFNSQGKVAVQAWKLPETGEGMRKISGNDAWGKIYGWLGQKGDNRYLKHCVIAGYSKWDPKTKTAPGHTALGGGYLGLFGSSSLYTWPSSFSEIPKTFGNATKMSEFIGLDDSAFRGTVWGSAATTLGATLHEMGHTFGLPHSDDPLCIMTRGFDRVNRQWVIEEPGTPPVITEPGNRARWCKPWAAILNLSPWYQREETKSGQGPSVKFNKETDKIEVSAPAGAKLIIGWRDDHKIWFKEFPSAPTSLQWSRKEILETVNSDQDFGVIVMDSNGARTDIRVPGKKP